MPRNAQLDSAGRLFLNHLLQNPTEKTALVAAVRNHFPDETARGASDFTRKQRQWLVAQMFLGFLENVQVPERGPKRDQNEIRKLTFVCLSGPPPSRRGHSQRSPRLFPRS